MAMDKEFNEAMHESTELYIKSRKPGWKPEFTGKSIDDNSTTEEKPKTTGRELTGKDV